MEKSLHMGIGRNDYISGKRNLLEIRAEILDLFEKLALLKEIKSQKAVIYRMLVSDYKSVMNCFEKLKKELPQVKLSVEDTVHERVSSASSLEEPTGKPSNHLESELLEIQAKLQQLNALE